MGTWTQQTLCDQHLAPDSVCRLCLGAPGTLFHRRFERAAFDADRRDHLSDETKHAARIACELGQDLEKFAAGLMPDPREITTP
eukprot:3917213-Pyramimonas_sp.AAC.1